jgi:hypothetical protein
MAGFLFRLETPEGVPAEPPTNRKRGPQLEAWRHDPPSGSAASPSDISSRAGWIAGAARHPCAILWRQLMAQRDQRSLLVYEAGAVGPQVLGYEFAWKLRLGRGRRSTRLASVQNSLPTSLWKLWKIQL